jgi:hypothetical protein
MWSQGFKLVGPAAEGGSQQGSSVALSADGNTALIGGPGDNQKAGAAWVWSRSSLSWSKLVPSDASAPACFGQSVALSADGNTALIGGPCDDGNYGAAWVFTRTAGAWSQYGNKLMGKPLFPNAAKQGSSVALSGDGLTALIGAPDDLGGDPGGVYVFTLENGTWKEQTRIAGSGSTGTPIYQGYAVALSADGDIAMFGGYADNSSAGAAWVFIRRNGIWTQQGPKLIGSGATGTATQGVSVALSSSGNTALIGGFEDNSATGATWVFIPPTNTHDFNGNTTSDIVWQDTSGNTAMWLMNGNAIASAGGFPLPGWSLVGQRDFNGDGKSDLLWRDAAGDTYIWLMNGTTATSALSIGNVSGWSVAAVGSFAGLGTAGIVWKDASSDYVLWLMNPSQPNMVASAVVLGTLPGWQIAGTGDFNGDGFTDLLWRNTAGDTYIWFMQGTTVLSAGLIGTIPPPWSVVGTGDFNGDGMADIVWSNGSGYTSVWLMSSTSVISTGNFYLPGWSIAQTGDYNGDGEDDLLWRDAAGDTYIWFMNGTAVGSTGYVATVPSPWAVQSLNAE